MDIDVNRIALLAVRQNPEATKIQVAYEAAEITLDEVNHYVDGLKAAVVRIREGLLDYGFGYPHDLIVECNVALGLDEEEEGEITDTVDLLTDEDIFR